MSQPARRLQSDRTVWEKRRSERRRYDSPSGKLTPDPKGWRELLTLQTFPTHTAPQIINAPEERPIAAWQEHYPDCWLLLEVTQEDEGEPLAGRLLAVTSEDMALVSLWQEQARHGKITALVYGRSTEAGPTVVA